MRLLPPRHEQHAGSDPASRFTARTDLGEQGPRLRKLLPRPVAVDPVRAAARIVDDGMLPLPGGTEFATAAGWARASTLPRTQQRWLHIHAFLAELVAAHERTGDAALLDRAVALVTDWRASFSYPRDAASMAFHDETVARRLCYWLRLFFALRDDGRQACAADLWQVICETVEVLASEDFYAGVNNHGMFQDLALLYFAACIEEAGELQAVPLRRLLAYFELSISDDGVHREHSPNYHFLIARNIVVHLDFVRAIDAAAAALLERILARMGRYAVDIVTPVGTWPPIGDCPPDRVPAHYYTTFFGAGEPAAPRRGAFFPSGGYAVIRDDPAKGTQQTWVLLCASHHGTYHKHRDELGILLYSGGWIITESGPFGYDYGRPECRHGYSSAAHSTLLIDERNPTRGDTTPTGLVGLSQTGDSDEQGSGAGFNRRLPGVLHERLVTLLRTAPLVRVDDHVEGNAPHRFSLLWQLAPDLRPVIVGSECHLMRGDEKAAKIVVESCSPATLHLFRGSTHPVFKGLSFPQMGVTLDSTVLRVSIPPSPSWQVTTTFVLQRRTAHGPHLRMQVTDGDWPILHHVDAHPDSGALLVAFPGFAAKLSYPIHYKEALASVPATKVFLADDFGPQGSYLIASDGQLALGDAVIALIESLRARHGVARERVVLLGSGKGGASALYFADRLGYGSVVAGEPQTRIGHFLLRQDLTSGPAIAAYMFPDATDRQQRLDRLIFDLPVHQTVQRFVHVGRGDDHCDRHVKPYVEHVERAGGRCELDAARNGSHMEFDQSFPTFVLRCLAQLLPDLAADGRSSG